MQYFLNISGRAEGPFELDEIRDSLNAREIEPDTMVSPADGSNRWTPLSSLLGLSPAGESATPAPPPLPLAPPPATASAQAPETPETPATSVLPPREYLRQIRANSCYGLLRAVIDVVFVLLLIGSALGLAGAIGGSFAGLARGNNAIVIGGAIASFCVSIVVLVTLRQATQLIIDIADTLLHHHSRATNIK
jgi:hypothetical protein